MFDFFKTIVFYDKKYCEKVISQYTGCKKIQVLRALADGELKPSDIKKYYNYGSSGFYGDHQAYVLIDKLSERREYGVKEYQSGCYHSMLNKIELQITKGNATITKHWVCA